jgi:phosphoribosylformylglycinamidine (FGAM) synthase PurS component
MEDNPHYSEELWEFDVDVVRRGMFSVMAKSREEAEAIVNSMDEDDLENLVIRWFSCEGEVS